MRLHGYANRYYVDILIRHGNLFQNFKPCEPTGASEFAVVESSGRRINEELKCGVWSGVDTDMATGKIK